MTAAPLQQVVAEPRQSSDRHLAEDGRPTSAAGSASPARPRLPVVIYVLAAGTFLMGTTEFVVAGLLPEIAADFVRSSAASHQQRTN